MLNNTGQNTHAIGSAHSMTPQSWLASRLARGQTDRFCEITAITPALASEFLKHNSHNRPLLPSAIKEYANLMLSGLWRLTAEGICFAHTGVLINGQHRLVAIERTGIPVKMTLWFGCDPDEFRVVDGGRKRTTSQVLTLDGYPHATLLASLAGVLMGMRASHSRDRAAISNQQIAAYAKAMLPVTAYEACKYGHRLSKFCSPTAAALAYWHLATTSSHASRIDEFWEGLSTGDNVTGPKLSLREWLNSQKGRQNNMGATVKRAAAFILAWNAWTAGKKRAGSLEWAHFTTLPVAR